MQLDQSQLQKLLAFLAESDIEEFRLEGDDFRLEVRRNLPTCSGKGGSKIGNISSNINNGLSNNQSSSYSTLIPIITPTSPTIASTSFNPSPITSTTYKNLVEINAPMVGTFYRAPAPGEPTFVELGSHIDAGQTVCILEAMKLMNELEAEVSGEIVEILVNDGTPVEFGQVLMRVSPSSKK
uniref:Acetyl-CoA carboxylase, biotin carboxyl carrier protein n=1 Tax=Paulinella longichromatophora TaxID=1708747 RepID=A0A2H4ZPE4_9EUKA|nr:acetyl-CoA carboxylase, biotin carboxyl carrier protein [Paulinella longichromatophora]